MDVAEAAGIDNLLYSSDVDFSCFADLAVVSPVDYRKEGEGSLMQARALVAYRRGGACRRWNVASGGALLRSLHARLKHRGGNRRGGSRAGAWAEPRGRGRVQVVITPCEKYMPQSNAAIAAEMHRQVQRLFPSAAGMEPTWHSVVKIQQSLYRCARWAAAQSKRARSCFPPLNFGPQRWFMLPARQHHGMVLKDG